MWERDHTGPFEAAAVKFGDVGGLPFPSMPPASLRTMDDRLAV